MRDYTQIKTATHEMEMRDSEAAFARTVIPSLVRIWLDDYRSGFSTAEVLEVSVGEFSYLFDFGRERLIAAWGISRGKHLGARDKSRMVGHPRAGGARFHRGHAIPHSMGGGADVNLVAQLARVNQGPFQQLERAAVEIPGALYFTYWIYPDGRAVPSRVEQGVLIPSGKSEIREHTNRSRD